MSSAQDDFFRQFRTATSEQRPLPGAIVIGAQKAGSTSLASYLAQHPRLVLAQRKEVHYFDGGRLADARRGVDVFPRGTDFYRGFFPLKAQLPDGGMCFEATPYYLFHPRAAERIHAVLPNVRLIAVLRDPVERAVSHYSVVARRGAETLNMDEAFRGEQERLRAYFEKGDYHAPAVRSHSYLSRGLYLQQLERYWSLFGREQLCIVGSGELATDTVGVLRRVFGFLGLDEDVVIPDLRRRNRTRERRSLEPTLRAWMDDWFEGPNQRLFDALGYRPDW
ncbi:MAG: sulfotransferase family protein [Gammaproteobacteria bacterium]